MIDDIIGRFKAVGDGAVSAVSTFVHLQLRGLGTEGDDNRPATTGDNGAEPVDDGVVVPQFGIAVRPVIRATLRALGIRWGDEVWLLKLWDKAFQPTDLEEGETRVWCVGNAATRIRARNTAGVEIDANGTTFAIDASGNVTITLAGGAVTNLAGTAGVQPAALGTTLQTYLSAIVTWANNHVHAGVTTGPGSTAVPATFLAAAPTITATDVTLK